MAMNAVHPVPLLGVEFKYLPDLAIILGHPVVTCHLYKGTKKPSGH